MEGKPQKKTECFLIQEPDNLVRKIRQTHMEKKEEEEEVGAKCGSETERDRNSERRESTIDCYTLERLPRGGSSDQV